MSEGNVGPIIEEHVGVVISIQEGDSRYLAVGEVVPFAFG